MSALDIENNLKRQVLEETIKELEEKNQQLIYTVKELKEKLQQQKEDQSDIYYYLNKKCDESFEIISALEGQLASEQADRELAEKMYEQKLEETRNSIVTYKTKIIELENHIERLKVLDSEDYINNKKKTTELIESLSKQLTTERKKYTEIIDEMESRMHAEKIKMKNALELKIAEIKNELELNLDSKLNEKAQKAQVLNQIIKKELEIQSKHADRLLEINQDIINKDRKRRIDLDIIEEQSNELMLKLATANKEKKSLLSKISNLEETIEKEKEINNSKLNDKDLEINNLKEQINKLSNKLKVNDNRMDEMWNFLSNSYHRIKLVNQNRAGRTTNNNENKENNGSEFNLSHENILVELVKQIALKYPTELQGFLQVGTNLEQTSKLIGKVGITSWDSIPLPPSSAVPSSSSSNSSIYNDIYKITKTVACQTTEAFLPFPDDSVWLNQAGDWRNRKSSESSVRSSNSFRKYKKEREGSGRHLDSDGNNSVSEENVSSLLSVDNSLVSSIEGTNYINSNLSDASSLCAQSVPTIIGQALYSNSSVNSNDLNEGSIKSLSHLVPKKPKKTKDSNHKNRRGRNSLPFPTASSYSPNTSPSPDLRSCSGAPISLQRAFPLNNSSSRNTSPSSNILVSKSANGMPSNLNPLSYSNLLNSFGDIPEINEDPLGLKLSGRKFVLPNFLPKIETKSLQ